MESIKMNPVMHTQPTFGQAEKNVTVLKNKDNKKKAIKVALVGLAALGAVGAAAVAIKKGQAAKAIKEIDIEKFKETGKFVNGKAIGKNGKPFTGRIVQNFENGYKSVSTYEKGVLKSLEASGKEGWMILK